MNYEDIIKERLSEYRYIHSINVSKSAVELSKFYGADEEKARIAGLLHDITKEEDINTQYDLIEKNGHILTKLELNNNAVLHQFSGASYCKFELGITDNDILNSISYHTTGRRDMSLLEQIIYTADFISAERDYPDVDIMRKLAYESLDNAMLYSLKFTINKISKKTQLLHPNTIECYNWIIEKGL